MPENDDTGDGEINDVEEFLREFDRIEYDETLIGLVGEGYDVNAPGDQAVADLLGAWRDDVGRVPVDESRFPSAHTASGKMPPAPTTGGIVATPKEIAAGLRGIELPPSPTESMNADLDAKGQEYMAAVDRMREQAAGMLDPDSPKLNDIHGAVEAAKREIQTSIEGAKEAIDNLWTGVADVGVAIDRAAEALEQI